MKAERSSKGLHRLAAALSCGIVLLISAGALVKSLEAGLSVPDWPLSYGGLNPPRWWEIENVRAEHGHRLIAGTIALFTVVLAVWVGQREPRRWVRRLGWLAVAAVLTQAALGGITVLFFLPTAVSVSHAALAQLFLCLVVTLALVTSRWWRELPPQAAGDPRYQAIAKAATTTSCVVFFQMLLGALMRHTGAGLAIPDFPLVFGGLLPPRFDFAIGVHYSHRLGALAVLVTVAWVVRRVWAVAAGERRLTLPASMMAVLVLVQVSLGGAVVLTGRAVTVNTLHVATGATLLATAVLTSVAAWRLGHGALAPASRPAAPAVAVNLDGSAS